ncbi:hypothetical protein HYPDE_25213 [Hyphomicrobium denitrificans 1NES1]|uniref:Uncharacterized protein n=1 Tax=Hyphomicrobium denitrificans 1NES1 TaxID=670307 RepID=N0B3C9_9HYPH|nr:hypothetical protein HYPDE_25213 [Hyphomicrobium denitrificans 1NES1]
MPIALREWRVRRPECVTSRCAYEGKLANFPDVVPTIRSTDDAIESVNGRLNLAGYGCACSSVARVSRADLPQRGGLPKKFVPGPRFRPV